MSLLLLLIVGSIEANSSFLNSDLAYIKNISGRLIFDLNQNTHFSYSSKKANKTFYKNTQVVLCSGVFIRPDEILTSAHCLLSFKDRDIKNLKFQVGSKSFSIISIRYSDSYMKIKSFLDKFIFSKLFLYNQLAKHDLALIKTTSKNELFSTVTLSEKVDNLKKNDLLQFSYDSEIIDFSVSSFKKCSLVLEDQSLEGNCDNKLKKGNSGGPLFSKENGKIKLVGITSLVVKDFFSKKEKYIFTPSWMMVDLYEKPLMLSNN